MSTTLSSDKKSHDPALDLRACKGSLFGYDDEGKCRRQTDVIARLIEAPSLSGGRISTSPGLGKDLFFARQLGLVFNQLVSDGLETCRALV